MDRDSKCRIDWDLANEILLVTLSGVIGDDEFWKTYETVSGLASRLAPSGAILDFSPVTRLSLSTRLVQALSRRTTIFPKDTARVAVAPRDLIYGLSRMYQILSDKPNIHVVRTMEEALQLLKISSPKFQPLEF
jgi:hypothetical protein